MVAAALALGAVATAGAVELELRKLNRSYSQLVDQLEPIVLGPVEVELRSPQHQLTLTRHRARLEPASPGTHWLAVEIEVSGSGSIDAVLRTAGLEGRLEDELVLPLQTLRLEGRIGLERTPEGYRITLVEAPPSVEVVIESRLASRLVPLCRQMALVLVNFDCAALEQALSRIQVPIPGPGTELLLPFDELSGLDVETLDDYLAAAAALPSR